MANEIPLSRESQATSPDQAIVVPSDTADLPNGVSRAFELSAAATVHYVNENGREITFAFTAGPHNIRLRKVFATGTTAAAGTILAIY